MSLIEILVQLRDRNQLTLPDRIVERMGLRGGDQLVVIFDDNDPGLVSLRAPLRSYKALGSGSYGTDAKTVDKYLAEERASWGREQEDPGSASDGTRFLTFAAAQRLHRQTDLTRTMYDADPFYRWPRCEVCGRYIARMNEHRKKHRAGLISKAGISTDERQKQRSASRVRKWRAAIAARGRSH